MTFVDLMELTEEIDTLLKKNEALENQITNYTGRLEECRSYNPFQQALAEIGKKKHSEDYNCYEHSKDLQKKLRELDIESSIFINENRDHAWLAVWIESTKGQFVGTDHKYSPMEIRANATNVICTCK